MLLYLGNLEQVKGRVSHVKVASLEFFAIISHFFSVGSLAMFPEFFTALG